MSSDYESVFSPCSRERMLEVQGKFRAAIDRLEGKQPGPPRIKRIAAAVGLAVGSAGEQSRGTA